MTEKRTRNWTFIVYPESAPQNWVDILCEEHVPFAVSPLHDKDINPTGEPKKPHYHVAFAYSGVKTYAQVEKVTKNINATIPQTINNMKGMLRYFGHLDNPDKYQYDISDINGYCGFDIGDNMKPSTSEKHIILKQIIQWVNDNKIIYYGDLMDYAVKVEYDWFSLLAEGYTFVVDSVIKSNRAKYKDLKEAEEKKNAANT